MRSVVFAAVVAGMSAVLTAGVAQAGSRDNGYQGQSGGGHKSSNYYRKGGNGTRVRGYSRRRGGYSYNAEDTINTYGDSRSNFGSTSSYRFEGTDRQTLSGPFDHGFFFDGGISARGGDSPYMN